MKCPHCEEEIIDAKYINPRSKASLRNIILVGFPLIVAFNYVSLDIEHGYLINWDLAIPFIFMMVYFIYGLLYEHHKVKGTFLAFKQ